MTKVLIPKKLFVPLKRLFVPERTLLIPMVILALGLHAALLAVPLPSKEEQKTPDDKQNPIEITQIPTAKPPTTASSVATVTVPPVGTTSKTSVLSATASSSESSTLTESATDESTSDSSTMGNDTASTSDTSSTASATKPAIASTKTAKTTSASKAATSEAESKNNSAAETTSTDSSAAPDLPSPASRQAVSPSSAESPKTDPSENPFANFPHYQPSKADCYGLGFGDNCRVVENSAIAQVADFFRKELAAQQFTANLVMNEPDRRVYKVSKGNKTLFLNIWQGNQKVAYLLSSVVYKQSPEEIKTETPR